MEVNFKAISLDGSNCHHGRFHRHDDDCSLALWVRGENLLMDSGLLYYEEKVLTEFMSGL